MSDYGRELWFGSFVTRTARPPQAPVELAQTSKRAGLDLVSLQDRLGHRRPPPVGVRSSGRTRTGQGDAGRDVATRSDARVTRRPPALTSGVRPGGHAAAAGSDRTGREGLRPASARFLDRQPGHCRSPQRNRKAAT